MTPGKKTKKEGSEEREVKMWLKECDDANSRLVERPRKKLLAVQKFHQRWKCGKLRNQNRG